MADRTVLHIGENSPEHVAYVLMGEVLSAEKVSYEARTRSLLLDTYAECIQAVKGNRLFPERPETPRRT